MKTKKISISRSTILLIFMFIVSIIIFARLLFLQVIKGDFYRSRADTGSVRTLIDPAPRGQILDRNGVVLADNIISYSIVYNKTPETELSFYPAIDKVMNIMIENQEKLKDDFMLKYDENNPKNPYSFMFTTSDEEAKKQQKLRFMLDNGVDEKVRKDFEDDLKGKSKDEVNKIINEKLLEYSPKDVYEYIRDNILNISYKSFFFDMCDLYKIDRDRSSEYFKEYFNIDANTENFKRIMGSYKNRYSSLSDDIEALINSLGLETKKFDKEKERAYVIVGAAMRLQMFSGYAPIVISNNIKEITSTVVNQTLSYMPGIDITTEPVRTYPFGTLASNIIGHLRSISSENSEDYKLKGYDVSKDYVGALGIESAFQDDLKGTVGGRIVKLNDEGRVVSGLGSISPYPGKNVQLTVDKDIQSVGEKALEQVMHRLQNHILFSDSNSGNATRGAAVMIDIKTGDILASVSLPGFDPNDFAAPGKLTIEKSNEYYAPNYQEFYNNFVRKMGISKSFDELFPINKKTGQREDFYDLMPKPFFNYATMTRTSPGSTFKPVTAVAALSEGIITPGTTIYDELRYSRYPGTQNQFKDWNSYSMGNVNVTRAIEVSNNYFFFRIGDLLQEQKGINKLAEYAWMFGLGSDPTKNEKNSTGIEIEEAYGQTYNDVSYRNLYMKEGFWPTICAQILKDNNINLAVTNEDSIEIKNLKNELMDEVSTQIKADAIETSEGKVYNLFMDLCKSLNIEEANFTNVYNNLIYTMGQKVQESRNPGNILNAAIGQGMSQYTPLQLAVYMATLANQGERKSVHVVKNILDSNNNVLESFTSETLSKLDIKPEDYAAILEGMKEVNYGEDGTVGEDVFDDFPIRIAGKTGSATFAEGIEDLIGRTSYAVYTGFAPADNPEVAFSVVIFDGGHGGVVAPVVLRMLEAYFKDELKAQGYTPKQHLKGYDQYDMDSFINELYSK